MIGTKHDNICANIKEICPIVLKLNVILCSFYSDVIKKYQIYQIIKKK